MSETADTASMRPVDREVDNQSIGDWQVRLTSYRLADSFVCIVSSADEGANLARARAGTRQDAIDQAVEKASRRLGETAD